MIPAHQIQSLRRELGARYRLKEHPRTVNGQKLTITGVEDVDVLLNDLVAAGPDSLEVIDERLPYWATLWRSSLALAETILAGDHLQPGTRVLELGCGLGMCAAAACVKGARVTATDYQPDALLFTRLNCLQNAGREPDTELLDWRTPPAGRSYDVLIGSDLVYEERAFDPLIGCFDSLLTPEGRVLFAEPNRQIARPFYPRLERTGWHYTALSSTRKFSVYLIARQG